MEEKRRLPRAIVELRDLIGNPFVVRNNVGFVGGHTVFSSCYYDSDFRPTATRDLFRDTDKIRDEHRLCCVMI